MPTAPRRTCRQCGTKVPLGQSCPPCEARRKARFDAERGDDRWFFASREWRTIRSVVLQQERTCRICGARAEVVDHVLPRRTYPHFALIRSNLRALCKQCHDARTAREQGFAAPQG